MNPLIILQARLDSSRLPYKALKLMLGRPMLKYTLERVKALKTPHNLVIATTNNPIDDALEDLCQKEKVACFRGEKEDVLGRFYHCAEKYLPSSIVRLTGDCPLMDPSLLDQMLIFFQQHQTQYDCVSNVLKRSYPKGYDLEIFSFHALKKAHQLATTPYDREHVTPYIYHHPETFCLYNFEDRDNFSHWNLSVDTLSDFQFVERAIQNLSPQNPIFGLKEMKVYLKKLSGESLAANPSSRT